MRLAVITITFAALPACAVDFLREVQPIFAKHCYECHGAKKQKNDYRLDIKATALTGGEDHAPNIVPGKSGESPLFRFVSGADEKIVMPPKSKLSSAEIDVIKRWIDEGAVWPEGVDVAGVEDRLDWWSFKPLPKTARTLASGVIEDFILAKLREHGLKPAPQADSRTQIRRLYYDLTGLPPSPADIERYAALPYEKLVDDLLASPRYGERWARHWLDLVHYGETHGYDKDKPRMNAWPYRDYVIRALNNDKPYGRFVEEQIAGDVLYPGATDGITALGFISAGPWDYIGHTEVPEFKLDGKIARHLDRDDMVQNTMGAFCSLTVGCAQCHYHKFDPISQEDYYSLQAVFAAIDRTDVNYYPEDAAMQRFFDLEQQRKSIATSIAVLEEPLKQKAGEAYASLSKCIDGAADKASGTNPNAKPDFGYHSAVARDQNTLKWVQVDLGRSVGINRIVLKPCYDDFAGIGGGFGFPVRFKIEASNDPTFKTGVTLVWRKHDATFMNDFKNPGLTPFETGTAEDDGVMCRYVRVTAVKLAERKNDYILALAEMEVFADKNGPNLAAGRPVTALDSIEAAPRWRKENLTDGLAPEARTCDVRRELRASAREHGSRDIQYERL